VAGLIAIADQMAGSDLGYINPALYKARPDPTKYATDFFDVTIGNNQTTPFQVSGLDRMGRGHWPWARPTRPSAAGCRRGCLPPLIGRER